MTKKTGECKFALNKWLGLGTEKSHWLTLFLFYFFLGGGCKIAPPTTYLKITQMFDEIKTYSKLSSHEI